jgi:hypothetical protein
MPIDLNEVMDLDHTIEKKGIYGHNWPTIKGGIGNN